MNTNFKRLIRNKLIAAAALLAVLSTAIVIIQNDRNGTPPGEALIEPTAQSARQRVNMPVNPGGAGGVRTAAIRQSPQPGQQSEMRPPEQPLAIIPVNGAMMQARLIHKVDPVYPEIAKSTGLNHTVKLRVITDENGMVAEISVNSGNQVFVEAAVEAVRQWRYMPALVDGIPVPASFYVDVFFVNNKTVEVVSSLEEPVMSGHAVILSDDPYDTSIRARIMNSYGAPSTYNGRNYYPITPDISAPVVYIDKLKLREMLYAGLPNDDRLRDLYTGIISVRMLINENGDIDGFQQIGGALKIPVNEKKELLYFRVQSPASYNGENIPSSIVLDIDVQEIIR